LKIKSSKMLQKRRTSFVTGCCMYSFFVERSSTRERTCQPPPPNLEMILCSCLSLPQSVALYTYIHRYIHT
jgi:hypothetical protein